MKFTTSNWLKIKPTQQHSVDTAHLNGNWVQCLLENLHTHTHTHSFIIKRDCYFWYAITTTNVYIYRTNSNIAYVVCCWRCIKCWRIASELRQFNHIEFAFVPILFTLLIHCIVLKLTLYFLLAFIFCLPHTLAFTYCLPFQFIHNAFALAVNVPFLDFYPFILTGTHELINK